MCIWTRETMNSHMKGGTVLRVSEEEKFLGVVMTKSTKPPRQCADASGKANSTLGMPRRTTVTKDKDTVLTSYR